MPYLIDGHNLIPKIPGMSLGEIDDEERLIRLLQDFSRLERKDVEVFFDKAPPGQQRARVFGKVIARFIRQGMTADDAIRARLKQLGNVARNWTVVSSDLEVQSSAKASRARVVSSQAFVRQLLQSLGAEGKDRDDQPEAGLSDGEVDEWLDLFGGEE